MTSYDETFGLPWPSLRSGSTTSWRGALADAGLSNLRIAETEKYAHVT